MNQNKTYEQLVVENNCKIQKLQTTCQNLRSDVYKIKQRLMWILGAINSVGVKLAPGDTESLLDIANNLEKLNYEVLKINDTLIGNSETVPSDET